jgi:hypothetical protein
LNNGKAFQAPPLSRWFPVGVWLEIAITTKLIPDTGSTC